MGVWNLRSPLLVAPKRVFFRRPFRGGLIGWILDTLRWSRLIVSICCNKKATPLIIGGAIWAYIYCDTISVGSVHLCVRLIHLRMG